jgi:hypothetical protein
VPPDPEADLDPPDLAELPVKQAPQVLRAPKALPVLLVPLAPPVPLVRLERLAPPVPLARTERLAPPVLLGLSVLPVVAVIWLLLLSS